MFALAASQFLGGDLQPVFLALWDPTSSQQVLPKLLWYAPPAFALAGGLLAALVPGVAALALLAAAIGWLAIGLWLPQGLDYQLIVPLGLAVLGAILAFFAGEASVRRRRLQRRERQAEFRALDSEAKAREDALRLEPQFPSRGEAIRQRLPDLPLKLDDPPTEPASRAASRPVPLSQDPMFEREAPRSSPLVLMLVGLNGIVVVVLAVAVAWMLLQSGQLSGLFQPRATTEPPAIEAKATPKTPKAEVRPADTVEPKAEASVVLAVPAAPAKVATAEPAAPTTFADPFSYCASVKTIDYVDHRYSGPRLPSELTKALGIPRASAPDRVSWRCLDGVVLACQAFDWPSCGTTPTVAEMVAVCAAKPEVERLFAPNGTWSCKAGKPVIPADATWPVDDRGFFPGAWKKVEAAAAG